MPPSYPCALISNSHLSLSLRDFPLPKLIPVITVTLQFRLFSIHVDGTGIPNLISQNLHLLFFSRVVRSMPNYTRLSQHHTLNCTPFSSETCGLWSASLLPTFANFLTLVSVSFIVAIHLPLKHYRPPPCSVFGRSSLSYCHIRDFYTPSFNNYPPSNFNSILPILTPVPLLVPALMLHSPLNLSRPPRPPSSRITPTP